MVNVKKILISDRSITSDYCRFPDSTKILPADLPKPLQQMTDEDIEAEQLKADEEKVHT